jgi:hypothetical protein
MVLLWRLLLAHIIADFPLQTDAVFAVKRDIKWGVFLHGTLFLLTALLLTGPYLRFPAVIGGLVFLWLFHVAVDKTKLELAGRGLGDHLGYFLLDQALHIGAIVLICSFLNRHSGVTATASDAAAIVPRLKLGAAYTLSIWASPLLIYYIRRLFSSRPGDVNIRQRGLWRILGYLERGSLTAVIIQGGWWPALAPAIFLPRTLLWAAGKRSRPSFGGVLLGAMMAVAAGLWVRAL